MTTELAMVLLTALAVFYGVYSSALNRSKNEGNQTAVPNERQYPVDPNALSVTDFLDISVVKRGSTQALVFENTSRETLVNLTVLLEDEDSFAASSLDNVPLTLPPGSRYQVLGMRALDSDPDVRGTVSLSTRSGEPYTDSFILPWGSG